jgi:hypothetical protein
MPPFKYFKESEIIGLNLGLVKMLDQARDIAGIPFVITSGFRNAITKDGVTTRDEGAHSRGLAVDLRCRDSRSRFLILKGLFAVGFVRIGDEVDHIHADIDVSLDVNVVWLK